MLNALIKWSLNNRITVLVGAIVLMVFGIYIAAETDVDVFPDLTAPTVTIITEAEGMSAQEVEMLITFPIETAINGTAGLRRLRSGSVMGVSTVNAEFNWGTDVYRARQLVSEKLSLVANDLPATSNNPVLTPISSLMGEIMYLAVASTDTNKQGLIKARTFADWQLRPALLSVQGVASVVNTGGDVKEFQITANPFLLQQFGISLHQIKDATAYLGENASGGIINQYGKEYIVQGIGRTTDLKDLGETFIAMKGEMPVRLKDIATVKIGAKTPIGRGSYNGKPAVIVAVAKQPQANTVELTAAIDEALKNLRTNLPSNILVYDQVFRQANFIQASISNLQKSLLEGAVFVLIVLVLFLMNWRITFISLLAIPLSFVSALIVLNYLGYNINTMSLGGLAIAIGSLVDDAIIDVENVLKRLRENAILPKEKQLGFKQIIYDASLEIRPSILNATLIIIVSFIPLFFLSGIEGRLLQPLGIAFITSLIASLFVAVMVTPVLCFFLLKKEMQADTTTKHHDAWLPRQLKKIYEPTLKIALRFPKVLLITAFVFFGVSVLLATYFGTSFLPKFNEGALNINVSGLPGLSLYESDAVAQRAEKILLEIPEVKQVSRRTGRSEQDEHALGSNVSEIELPLTMQDRPVADVLADIRERLSVIPGMVIEIGQPISHRIDHILSGTRANIAIKVFGKSLTEMYRIGKQLEAEINQVDGAVDVFLEQQIETAQIRISPMRERLAQLGISIEHFNEFIEIALAGQITNQLYEREKNFDLRLRLEKSFRDEIEELGDLPFVINSQQSVPLKEIAKIASLSTPFKINREKVQRKLTLSANVAGRDLGSVVTDIEKRIANMRFPDDIRIELGGQFESQQRATRLLGFTSIGALLIIIFLLYVEFKNLGLSLIVLLNLPLALIGGIWAVAFSSGVLSIAGIIGFISLLGIATRNGILLVSHFRALETESDLQGIELIVKGAMDRINPVLMTALTTSLALIPIALSPNTAGNEIQSPMAIVILGGLLTATILNLLVVPAVYWLWAEKQK
ncbi:UNVERIFIED_CONTAM: hypothetical protein GTU68_039904 [Idotea baltica]|nr:hypothetical protein [Idotea baltica]